MAFGDKGWAGGFLASGLWRGGGLIRGRCGGGWWLFAVMDCVGVGAWRGIFWGFEIERRPRGASRATLAPTFVSGQSRL